MRRSLIPTVLLLVLVAAGCATPGGGGDDGEDAQPGVAEWSTRALASGDGHDHANLSQHAGLSTPNFRIVGWNPLVSASVGRTLRGNLCGDAGAVEGGRQLAVVESRQGIAFSLADVTDPANPQWLGELALPDARTYDLALVPDGRHVVLVTSEAHSLVPQTQIQTQAQSSILWRSPCAEGGLARWHEVQGAQPDPLPHRASVILVDITDPSQPRIVQQLPLVGYGHGVSSTILDGMTWVALATVGCVTGTPPPPVRPPVGVPRPCPSAVATFQFYELVDTPAGGRLVHLSTFVPPRPQEIDPMRATGHTDAWVAKHPLTNVTMGWLASGNDGLLVLDLTDPRAPKLVGRWNDYDPERPGDTGQMHSIRVVPEPWDGRHYIVTGPEFAERPVDAPTGIVRVLDSTDPANLREVAAWTLPHDVEWNGTFQFSNHYLTTWNRTIFVSMYHGGVWAIDTAGIGHQPFTLLRSVGVFLPDRVSPAPPEETFRWTPTVEEVHALPDGTLITFDSNSGLYAFRYDDRTNPVPPPEPWPVEPVG